MKKALNILIIAIALLTITGCIKSTTNTTKTEIDSIKEEIKDVDKNLNQYIIPLGIDSIKLMKSGKVILIINDSEIGKGEKAIANDVNKIYLFTYGNGGYRTILFIKNDGTVSAVNASKLIEEKKIEVINNLGNYKDITSIKQEKDQEGMLIYAITKNGEEKMLDGYIQ